MCKFRAVFKKIDLFFNAYLILNGKHGFRITALCDDAPRGTAKSGNVRRRRFPSLNYIEDGGKIILMQNRQSLKNANKKPLSARTLNGRRKVLDPFSNKSLAPCFKKIKGASKLAENLLLY
jgi:hypothetical protein